MNLAPPLGLGPALLRLLPGRLPLPPGPGPAGQGDGVQGDGVRGDGVGAAPAARPPGPPPLRTTPPEPEAALRVLLSTPPTRAPVAGEVVAGDLRRRGPDTAPVVASPVAAPIAPQPLPAPPALVVPGAAPPFAAPPFALPPTPPRGAAPRVTHQPGLRQAAPGLTFAPPPRTRARLRAAAGGLVFALLLFLFLLALPRLGQGREGVPADPAVAARAATAAICDQVAAQAAQESGVPPDVLRAITRTETGRKMDGRFQPWPWTINREGKGLWFDSQAEAIAYAEQSLKEGSTSFDTACFQINYRWHGKEFESLSAMFDPLTNARYAARFLSQLHAEHGDWSKAAGSYHSRTAEFATRYAARFDRIRADLGDMPDDGVLLAALPPAAPGTRVPASFTPLALPRTPGGVQISQKLVAGGLLFRASAPVSLLTPARPLFN